MLDPIVTFVIANISKPKYLDISIIILSIIFKVIGNVNLIVSIFYPLCNSSIEENTKLIISYC